MRREGTVASPGSSKSRLDMAAVRLRLLLVWAFISAYPLAAVGDDAPVSAESAVEAAQAAAKPNPPILPAEEAERRRSAYAGLLALVGILIAGIGLLALVMFWGGRLRRTVRQPLPNAQLKDELWFLRPPKPPVQASPGLQAKEADGDSATNQS